MTTKRKMVGEYELGRTLGRGTFGKVKYAEHVQTGARVAIKILCKEELTQKNMLQHLKSEISIMKLVDNPHVIKLHEVLESKSNFYLVLELVTGGELFNEILRETRFTEDKARFYFRQLVDGVEHCHLRGICHRDLKPENLLVDENRMLKISDFGLSALNAQEREFHTRCGTPNYVAPEVLTGKEKGYDGRCADIWSMGVVLFILVAGYLPFNEANLPALFKRIKGANYSPPLGTSSELQDLLSIILVADPKNRATIEQIRQHKWFSSGNSAENCAYHREPWLLKHRSHKVFLEPSKSEPLIEIKNINGGISRHDRNNCENKCHRRSASELQVKVEFRFPSHETVPVIVRAVYASLFDMGCQVQVIASTIKAEKVTPRGMISVTIRVEYFQDSRISRSVHVKRGKGDLSQYFFFFDELLERIQHLIQR